MNGQFTGLKWQCIHSWLIQVKEITFEDVANTEDLWKLKTAIRLN